LKLFKSFNSSYRTVQYFFHFELPSILYSFRLWEIFGKCCWWR